jgi:hypothetical protein
MCRSKAEGGRRCPGGAAAGNARARVSGPGPASETRDRRSAARAERRERYGAALNAFEAAEAAVGPLLGNPSCLVIGPLARGMLTRLLNSQGDNP